MTPIYTVGTAILLVVVAALWLAGSEDEARTLRGPAISSDSDGGRRIGGNAENPPQERSPPEVTASKESSVGGVELVGTIAGPTGVDVSSAAGSERVALRGATQAIPDQIAGAKSSHPAEIDKAGCEATARTLSEAWSIFDLTPTQAVVYARSRSTDLHASPSAFSVLQARLLAPLCSGSSAFNRDYEAQMEFVAIGTASYARILVGDHWISDGTVVSQLSETDQAFFANSFIEVRRQTGPGPGKNMFREDFDRRLAQNPRELIAGP
jgi:hypothetical protein